MTQRSYRNEKYEQMRYIIGGRRVEHTTMNNKHHLGWTVHFYLVGSVIKKMETRKKGNNWQKDKGKNYVYRINWRKVKYKKSKYVRQSAHRFFFFFKLVKSHVFAAFGYICLSWNLFLQILSDHPTFCLHSLGLLRTEFNTSLPCTFYLATFCIVV